MLISEIVENLNNEPKMKIILKFFSKVCNESNENNIKIILNII